jgi:O-succinylbenzoic acid--CoA ligase
MLSRIPVPPGRIGVDAVLGPLADALAGSGPAIAPVPTVSATHSSDYVHSVVRAVQASDGPLEDPAAALVVATSGSTGAPRGVVLTAAQATALTPVANGTGRPQWVAALPVTSMGGLNVLVRALAADRAPAIVASIGGAGPFTTAAFAAAVRSCDTDDIRTSLVPAQVARLLSDDEGIEALRACRLVLVGGAALRTSVRSAAESLGVTLTSTYGATETAGGCVLDGRPVAGTTVRLEEDGRIVVTGPSVASGYRGDPAATAAAFSGRSFRTHDLGLLQPDGRLVVTGRADDVVIVNGVNVSPTAVEHLAADLPDVAAAAAVVLRRADAEPAIWLFVQPRDGADVAGRVREEVVDRLGRAARPSVRTVGRIPHLPNGKVDRERLLDWAREA